MLISCGSNTQSTKEEGEEDIRIVKSIRVDESTIPQDVYAGSFKITNVFIWVEYDNGDTERVSLTNENLSVQSIAKLNKIGTQVIEVNYEKCKASFNLDLLDPTDVQYSLIIHGGIPVAVNGEAVKINPSGDTFEGLYDKGTKVTVEWIEEEGKYFTCWKSGDKTIDNQHRTVVVMDGDKEYTAYSDDLLFMVTFVTYQEALKVAPIEDRKTIETQESIIAEMQMDDYVFVGWTETELTPTQALSGEVDTDILVSFPFDVQENTTFYAVWEPIGFSYTTVSIALASGRRDGKQIVSYTGSLSNLTIPSKNDGQDVVSISKDAFNGENAKLLTTVTIPASIVDIEEGSFRNCSSVQSFYVDVANQYYSAVGGVLYKNDQSVLVSYPLGKVYDEYKIEPSVSTICNYAFYNAIVGAVVMPSSI